MLYIVPTPIGNLADFTNRAVEVLSSCAYILCEDTRRSKILLDHYQIKTPLRSFHQFSEAKKEEEIVEDLREGKQIALISDAGTPLISDPGERLICRCRSEGLPLTALPGPCALITALVCCSFAKEPFHFWGFLPKKGGECTDLLLEASLTRGTSLFYAAPQQISDALEQIHALFPNKRVCLARELTKRFEEVVEGTAEALLPRYKETEPRGEFVLLLDWEEKEGGKSSETLLLLKEMQERFGLSTKEAIEAISVLLKLPKKQVYSEAHRLK